MNVILAILMIFIMSCHLAVSYKHKPKQNKSKPEIESPIGSEKKISKPPRPDLDLP